MSFDWGAFSPTAKASLKADARVNVWEGSVRSGKTVTSLAAFMAFLLTAPQGKPLLIGKTERTLIYHRHFRVVTPVLMARRALRKLNARRPNPMRNSGPAQSCRRIPTGC